MALSRMVKLGEICNTRCTFFLHRPNVVINKPFTNNVRHFQKKKNELPKCDASMEIAFRGPPQTSNRLSLGGLFKPFLFATGFSAACFTGAVIWQYESMRHHAVTMLRKRKNEPYRKHDSTGNSVVDEIVKWWKSLTPGEKIFVPICAANVLVFAAWRFPPLQTVMLRYFCSNPAGKSVCLPMLLSTFSHYSAFHLLANMYVLHSFSTGAVSSLGKEQFLALYLSAGVISSFTSYFYKVVTKQTGLSLGASGAIMAVLGYVCTQYPETKLGIILLPFFVFSAGSAIKVLIGLDTAGVLFGWKFFDHAAHLGGAATGIGWALWGNENLWLKRDLILQYWHEFRGRKLE